MTNFVSELGELVDPHAYCDKLNLLHYKTDQLMSLLSDMLLIRIVEEKIAKLVQQAVIKTPCHLAIGQEAIAVGVLAHLTKSDKAFGTHRAHPHYLAMGGSVDKLFAEILGKESGCSHGFGGSMHLYAGDVGFHGSVPIVAGTIPIAVGAALAAKMDKQNAIAVCFFGDGACEEGVLHESLNLASTLELPVLFVCENNLYSSHLDIKLRQPSDRVSRFAEAHKIKSYVVDGNDVALMHKTSQEIVETMRSDAKPVFLEAITYRWLGHVGADENIDVGVRRKREDLDAWKKRDPIRRLREAMLAENILTHEQYDELTSKVHKCVEDAAAKAIVDPCPQPHKLYEHVYSRCID